MRSIMIIIQTICMSFAFVLLLIIVSFLRKLWLKTAVKIRQNHNQKHGLPLNQGVGEIDSASLSYRMDSIEGRIAAAVLFLIGLLFNLIVPIPINSIFCIVAIGLSVIAFLFCFIVRNSGTKKYRLLFYISCGVSLLLVTHIIVSCCFDVMLLVKYNNGMNALLYIWSTMLIYKLLLDKNLEAPND